MHINVTDLLAESLGYSRSYKLSGETPQLETVQLTEPVSGDLTISRSDDGLLAQGRFETAIQLECHRCLRSFTRPIEVSLRQTYSSHPGDEDLPIDDGVSIDLAQALEQEIIVNLPIKILHDPDCQGIEIPDAQYTKEDRGGSTIADRLKKGPSHRGRTQETNHQ